MAKQSIAKPTRSITSALLLVALLLPVILYLCVFWRSGVFSSVSDISGFFASGTYSMTDPCDPSLFTIHYDDAATYGLDLTWDPASLTLVVNGDCTVAGFLTLLTFPGVDDVGRLNATVSIDGDLGSSYFYFQNYANQSALDIMRVTGSKSVSLLFGHVPFIPPVLHFACRTRVQSYDHVVIQFSEVSLSTFFNDSPGLIHSSGSFGEFLCNNFTVSEVNELVARPVLYAVSSLNNGYVSAESQYNIYVICAYFTYVIFVYLVFLIVKLLTFIPCVIIKYVNKATGGDHFG